MDFHPTGRGGGLSASVNRRKASIRPIVHAGAGFLLRAILNAHVPQLRYPYFVVDPVAAGTSVNLVRYRGDDAFRRNTTRAVQIIEPLGAGGMGEVYKSRDTRLERTVAVKVVSASLASDPTWRQRFDREARILAALSNPHICPIFDVGRHDGVDFLVMEYLDGETLTARLARGPLPWIWHCAMRSRSPMRWQPRIVKAYVIVTSNRATSC